MTNANGLKTIKTSEEAEYKKYLEEKIFLLEEKKRLEFELPHLYGQKFYPWSRKWWESTNDFNIMMKGNQVGGTSVQFRKCIHWATDKEIRKKLFGHIPADQPLIFLYFMPSLGLLCREFHTKYIPQFMPRGKSREEGWYRWEAEYDHKSMEWINFIKFPESNTIIITLSYGQDPHKAMQASSPHAIFADEEMPSHIFGEVMARLSATKGYFHLTCTPTRGEKLWNDAFNGNRFPDAFKLNVSQYDCLYFEDGTPGHHSVEGVRKFEQTLGSQREINVRVHGKYEKLEGLLVPSFDEIRNVGPRLDLGKDRMFFGGLDYGSGGTHGHPAATCIIEVSQELKMAQVHRLWKGNNEEKTTSTDVINKYLEIKGDVNCAVESYDPAASDLGQIAMGLGLAFTKANNKHEAGFGLLNTLFKNKMLHIPDEPEFRPLIDELNNLRSDTKKKDADDHAVDCLRYGLMPIPFDFTGVTVDPNFKQRDVPKEKSKKTISRDAYMEEDHEYKEEIDREIAEYNDFLEAM